MPVTTGAYSDNETQIYSYLVGTMGLNTAAACGILANIEHESGFNNTALGDNGTSYGICQWHDTRFTDLKNYCNKQGLSYKTITGQLSFLEYELKNTRFFDRLYELMHRVENTSQGAYDVAHAWCVDFEVPADKYVRADERGKIAQERYWSYYSVHGDAEVSMSSNVGQSIVIVARSTVDLEYIKGGDMYSTDMLGADAPGLVYYCYNEVGFPMIKGTVDMIYQEYKDTSTKYIDRNQVCAGDLLFYKQSNSSSEELTHVAIANGAGGRIHAKGSAYGIVEEEGLGSPTHILRLLSDAETSQLSSSDAIDGDLAPGLDPTSYLHLTTYDPYSQTVLSNLSRMQAEGYDYGYLIDMSTDDKGEFKFYVPEFTEQAGAHWSTIDIRGRSVSVQSYDNTASRNITVSLDLYAGVGLYAPTSTESGEDTVSRLHRDLYFVKSLEYPDYTHVITRPPATVHLILGSAINMVGVVSNVIVEHLKPLDQYNRSMYAKLSFTVTQTAVNPIDYRDVRNGQYTLTSTGDIDSLVPAGDIVDSTNAPTYAGGGRR